MPFFLSNYGIMLTNKHYINRLVTVNLAIVLAACKNAPAFTALPVSEFAGNKAPKSVEAVTVKADSNDEKEQQRLLTSLQRACAPYPEFITLVGDTLGTVKYFSDKAAKQAAQQENDVKAVDLSHSGFVAPLTALNEAKSTQEEKLEESQEEKPKKGRKKTTKKD